MSRNDHILTLINFLEVHAGSYKTGYRFEEDMNDLFQEALQEVLGEYFPNEEEGNGD